MAADATQSSQAESSTTPSISVNGDAAGATTTTSSLSVNSDAAGATTTTPSLSVNSDAAGATTTTPYSSTNVGASVETTSSLMSLSHTQPAGNSASRTPSSVASPSHTPTNETVVPISSQSNAKFSSGTLAGAIVGAFAGGCILALLLAFLFFCFRKKTRKPREQDRDSAFIEGNTGKVSGQTITTFAGSSTTASSDKPLPPVATAFKSQHLDLSTYIPQPADDNSVCMRIQSLFDQAGLHVENYYSRTASNPPLTQDLLARLSHYDSAYLPASLITMLSRPRSQRAVLTHALVDSLVRAIQPGATENSLLPPSYAQISKQQGSEMANAATDRAEFAWRMLTSFLYASDNHSPTLPRDNIMTFAEEFTKAFEPYSNSQFAEDDRLRHLATISKSAADLGIWLFSQPCSFKFQWITNGVSGDTIVVLPALVKVCDEQGRRLAVPETLAEEKTVQI